jgi:hypothetical protein
MKLKWNIYVFYAVRVQLWTEIVGNNFESGALGPGTIVGSAAFNLMGISAVCVAAIPGVESRQIKG